MLTVVDFKVFQCALLMQLNLLQLASVFNL